MQQLCTGITVTKRDTFKCIPTKNTKTVDSQKSFDFILTPHIFVNS